MTDITKKLKDEDGSIIAELAARIDFTTENKLVSLTVSGTIIGDHGQELRDFVQNLSYFPGSDWRLCMTEVDAMSLIGMRALVKYARVLRKKGCQLVVENISPGLRHALKQLKAEHLSLIHI